MRKTVITLLIMSLASCGKGDKALYSSDQNFNKLNEEQLIENVIGSKNERIAPHSILNKVTQDFSYDKFYRLLEQEIENRKDISLDQILHVSKIVSLRCNNKNQTTQYKIINKLLRSNIFKALAVDKKAAPYYSIIEQEAELINKCRTSNDETKKLIKKNHSVVFTLPSEKILSSLELVTQIDQKINQEVISANSFSSYSALELSELVNNIVDTDDLKMISKLLKLHKKISPLSQDRRKLIIKKAFDRSSGLTIIENSSLDSISSFIIDYLKEDINHNQNKLKQVIELIISKIEKKYQKITRFEDIDEVLQDAWTDYTLAYNIINSEQLKDKSHSILSFNQLNKVFENIYEAPLNRTPAISFLEGVYGQYRNLALSHILRLKGHDERLLDNTDISHLERETTFNGLLDNLLLHRLKLLSKDNQVKEKAVDNYCNFLNTIKFGAGEMKPVHNITNLINNTQAFGCYHLKVSNTLSEDEIAKDLKEKLNINFSSVNSNVDLLIRADDTDINITAGKYNGPIWYLPTKRSRGKRSNPITNLDAHTTSLVLEIVILNNDKKIFSEDSIRLFYNYDFKAAETPGKEKDYIGQRLLKSGFRGGDLIINSTDNKSHYPIVINGGGKGEMGPDTISPGAGINSTNISNILYNDENINFYENLLYTNSQTFTELDRYRLNDIVKYRFNVNINHELTRKLHDDLCGKERRKTPYQLCYTVGNGFEFRDLQSNELGFLNKAVNDEFGHAIKIANQTNAINKLLTEAFSFPPSSASATGTSVIFSHGKQGKSGRIELKISN
jgi:hypothetical protein